MRRAITLPPTPPDPNKEARKEKLRLQIAADTANIKRWKSKLKRAFRKLAYLENRHASHTKKLQKENK